VTPESNSLESDDIRGLNDALFTFEKVALATPVSRFQCSEDAQQERLLILPSFWIVGIKQAHAKAFSVIRRGDVICVVSIICF